MIQNVKRKREIIPMKRFSFKVARVVHIKLTFMD